MSQSVQADPKLKEYATDRQWQYLEALAEHGSERKAADALGVHKAVLWRARQAVLKKAAMHGYAPDYELIHPLAPGQRLKGASTCYDPRTGEAILQWVKSEADKDRQQEIFLEAIAGLTEDIPKAKAVEAPKHVSEDMCACYPVGDHHLGMLSWAEETGADYDLKIARHLITSAMDALLAKTDSSEMCLIPLLGDLLHYDSFETVTPTNKNSLDSDTRFPKVVRSALSCARYLIDSALKKHKHVHVIVEIGNHDLASSIFLMECLKNIYENEPRVSVDTSPSHFHYFRFGSTLVGTHHGHGVKMENLPLIMATDRASDWGATKYRYWWTGHIHHNKTLTAPTAHDYAGCTVESFRVLCPTDAWGANKGYRPIRDMKAITLHKKYGEVERVTVKPEMFQ